MYTVPFRTQLPAKDVRISLEESENWQDTGCEQENSHDNSAALVLGRGGEEKSERGRGGGVGGRVSAGVEEEVVDMVSGAEPQRFKRRKRKSLFTAKKNGTSSGASGLLVIFFKCY